MDMYINDEQNTYRIIAMDMLKTAWNSYNATIRSVTSVLREHGFSDEEILQIILDSRN